MRQQLAFLVFVCFPCGLPDHASKFLVNSERKDLLTHRSEAPTTPQPVVKRGRILLRKSSGAPDEEIADEVGVHRPTCRLWRQRFLQAGPDGLWAVKAGRGRKPTAGLAEKIVRATRETPPKGQPPGAHGAWPKLTVSTPARCAASGRNLRSNRIGRRRSSSQGTRNSCRSFWTWREFTGTHRRTPSCSVLMKRAKSRPGIALNRVGRANADGARPGRMTLCATEPPRCSPRGQWPREKWSESVIHNSALKSFSRSSSAWDAGYPEEVELPLVLDQDGPHQHARGKGWLARHPRVKPHCIPTSSSGMNWVERWLAEQTGRAVGRGSFSSVPSFIAAVVEFIEQWNPKPKPWVWTAKAEDILAKIQRGQRRLEQSQPGGTQARSGRAKTRKQGLVVDATQH